jgi:hypothetical protein
MALADVALVLGPVQFAGTEIPERIGFGGQQRIAVHDLPGGQRIIDALGPLPTDIAWTGIFSGPDATLRARMLDTLRAQGTALTLTWDVFFYSVIIRTFEASYRNTAWVPYRIEVAVVQDNAQVLTADIVDLVTDTSDDAAAAVAAAALGGVLLAGVAPAIAASGATVRGTSAYFFASSAVMQAQASVDAAFSATDAGLGSYVANGVASAGDVAGMITVAGNAANLASSQAYLNRLNTNMINAGS